MAEIGARLVVRDAIRETLEEGIDDRDFRVQMASIGGPARAGRRARDPGAAPRRRLRRPTAASSAPAGRRCAASSRVRRRTLETARLSDAVETLRRENGELKTRLDRLESEARGRGSPRGSGREDRARPAREQDGSRRRGQGCGREQGQARRPGRGSAALAPMDAMSPSPLDPGRRAASAARASVVVASALAGLKLVAAIFSGSMALAASFVDSLTDVFSSSVNLVAIRIGNRPADEDHRYGHGKAEGLAGMFQGAVVGFSGVFLIVESVRRLSSGARVASEWLALAVMAFSTLASVWITWFLRRRAKETGSPALARRQRALRLRHPHERRRLRGARRSSGSSTRRGSTRWSGCSSPGSCCAARGT